MRALRRASVAPYLAVALSFVAFLAAQADDDLALRGHLVWADKPGAWGWRAACVAVAYFAFVGIYEAGKIAGARR